MNKFSVISKIVKIIGGFLVLGGIIAIVFGGVFLINARGFLAKAVKAEGSVVKLEKRDST